MKVRHRIFRGGKHHAAKYDNNPIHRFLVNGFMDDLLIMTKKTGKRSVFEIGCGEGQLLGVLYDNGYEIGGMDLDDEAVEMTKINLSSMMSWGGVTLYKGICMI